MLTDKHIIITGGGSGVGAEIARDFAQNGAKVTVFGRNEEKLKAQGHVYQVCDVTSAEAVQSAVQAAIEQHGPVEVAIANAGAAESVPFSKMSCDDLNKMLAVNLTGVFNLWQAALPSMKAAGWGRLIAVASTAGLKGYPYVSGYVAAKHAVVGLTRSVAIELGTSGITANAICPGFIETPMLTRSINTIVAKTGMSNDDAEAALKKNNPQNRFIQTDEVAGTALWLCSDAARSVNGHALALSGGEI